MTDDAVTPDDAMLAPASAQPMIDRKPIQVDPGEAAPTQRPSTVTPEPEAPKKEGRSKGQKKERFPNEDAPLPGFSESATKLYYEHFNRYLLDLERFSRFKAKQASADDVSRRHVREAAAFLSVSQTTSQLTRICKTLGGIFLGAGISQLINLVQNAVQHKQTSLLLVLLTIGLFVVGTAMIAILLARD